jgi:DNA polymerase III subunit tau, C-terminal domain
VTRPAADLSRESLAFRLEKLESEQGVPVPRTQEPGSHSEPRSSVSPPAPPAPDAPIAVELEQLQEAWRRSILPAVEQRSIPIGKTLAEAHPAQLAGDTLTLAFPQTAAFHLKLAEDPKNAAMLRDALYEVTGRKLAVSFELGDDEHAAEDDDTPASEEDVLELMKSTFDARELDE